MAAESQQTAVFTTNRAAWMAAVPLLGMQLLCGLWYMPQLSFFPIYLQEHLGMPTEAVGAVVAAGQITGMAAALFGGAITARLGSKWTLVLGNLIALIGSLVYQIDSPVLAAILWTVAGPGLALGTLGGASYLTRLSARRALGLLSAFFMLTLTAGGAIANPVAGFLIQNYGFGAYGWATTAATAVSVAVGALLLVGLGDRTSTRSTLRSFWTEALTMVRRPVVRTVLAMRSLPTIFYGLSSLLLPLLMNNLSDKGTVAAFGTTYLIVASATQLLVGRLADRFGARRPTLVVYACVIVSAVGMALTAGSVWGLFLFGVIGIAAAWGLSTLMYVWVSDGLPKSEHAWMFGMLHAVWSLSMTGGQFLGGTLVSIAAWVPFAAAGAINLGSLALTSGLYRRLGGMKDG